MFERVEENGATMKKKMEVLKGLDLNGISRNGKYAIRNEKRHWMVLIPD